MMDMEKLESQLAELPLLGYFHIDPQSLEFNDRIRWICENECPMYGKTWACPPGTGSVADCEFKCRRYKNCLMIATITEVEDITDIEETLATRPEHEEITNQVRDLMRQQAVFVSAALELALRHRTGARRTSPGLAVHGTFIFADPADPVIKLQTLGINVKITQQGQFRQLTFQQFHIHHVSSSRIRVQPSRISSQVSPKSPVYQGSATSCFSSG